RKTDTGLAALVDLCGFQGDTAREAAGEILESYVDSPRLEKSLRPIADAYYWGGGGIAAVESGLRTIIARSPHKSVRAAAMLSLAQWFMGVEAAGKAKRLEACDLLDAIQKGYEDAPCAKE